MNIIFYRYKSICEPDYIDAFKRLGITVIEDLDGADNNRGVTEKTARLGKMIADNLPMFVFSINFFPFVAKLCDRLKIKYVAESVDCPVFEIFNKAIMSEQNKIFLFDRKQYEAVKDANLNGVFYLPLGSPVERVSTLLGETSDYKFDISFVGSLYNEKDPFLQLDLDYDSNNKFEKIIEKQIKECAYGLGVVEQEIRVEDVERIKAASDSFYSIPDGVIDMDRYVAINDYISPHSAYLERVMLLNKIADAYGDKIHLFTQSDTSKLKSGVVIHGGVNSINEMPFVFRQSKINLNITMRSIQSGIPQRIWDIMACGGFVLTNDQPEIHEYFEVGKHLEVYRSQKELIEKIDYYLKNEDERRWIAENGFNEVLLYHKILDRVVSMIKMMQ